MKNVKKNVMLVLGAVCALATCSAVVSMNNGVSASADTTTPTATEFYMQEGAAVRTAAGELGIRFTATITKDYWNSLQETYGTDATYSFYSAMTADGVTKTKNHSVTPTFTDKTTFDYYSTVVYKTEELGDLVDEAADLAFTAKTYVDITKSGTTTTLVANGEPGTRSMKAVANAAVLYEDDNADLLQYFTVGNRSEKSEGYVLSDDSGAIEMAALPAQATDIEVYCGAKKLTASYADGKISFKGVELEDGKTETYISVFVGNTVYSSKVEKANAVTSANITALQTATSGYWVLTGDIDMSDVTWGPSYGDNVATAINFSGTFDGNGYAIRNFTTGSTQRAGGLFNWLTNATIKNVTFTDATISGANAVIAGRSKGGNLFENVAIEVISMSKINSALIVVVGDGGEGNYDTYKNVLLSVEGVTAATSSGFLGGLYAKGVIVENVYAIANSTGLGLVPTSHETITTKINGTDGEAAVQNEDYFVCADYSEAYKGMDAWTVPFLKDCFKKYFVTEITEANINVLQTATSGYYVLTTDINMSGITWGRERSTLNYKDYYFKGTLDGNGHTIRNFTTGAAGHAGGLLWSLDGATVKNLVFTNATTKNNNGVIAGRVQNATKFENIAVEVSSMATTGSGVCATATERDIQYTNVIMYVKGSAGTFASTSSFLGGTYAKSVTVNNVWLITDTEIQQTPSGSVTTEVTGTPTALSVAGAAELDTTSLPTDLLKNAYKTFFPAE